MWDVDLLDSNQYAVESMNTHNAKTLLCCILQMRNKKHKLLSCDEPTVYLHSCGEHEAIAYGDNDDKSDDRRWDTARQEMLDFEVSLSRSLILHHDGS
jgi:hypothetical protein